MKFPFALVGVSALLFQILSIGVVSAQTTSLRTDDAVWWEAKAKEWREAYPPEPVPFTTLCKNKDAPISIEWQLPDFKLQHTIDVLLEVAGTQNCQQADSKLRSLTSLSLAHKKITDLHPLSSFVNLKTLDLQDNEIGNVQPLARLNNLTGLNLYKNNIFYVEPFAYLTNLTYLDLSVNQIKDVKPLARLTKLTILKLRKNQIKDVASLASLNKLIDLTLRRNPIDKKVCPLNPASICDF